MNWEKAVLMAGQISAMGVLGALVALGHNSAVQDALLAVCGSVAGIGVYQAARKSNT